MTITNTYITKENTKKIKRQSELHRKCLLILQTASTGGK